MTLKFDENDDYQKVNQDIEFLRDLQHELKTQDTDGNAEPVFWGVMETTLDLTDGDYAGEPYITYDDGYWSLKEAVEEVDSQIMEYDQDIRSEWSEVDKHDPDEVYDFMKEKLHWDNVYDVVYMEKKERLSRNTGAFLTKRACKQYIEKYGYNHSEPHTYAMTAFRNYELERLLNIIKNLNI